MTLQIVVERVNLLLCFDMVQPVVVDGVVMRLCTGRVP